MGSVRVPEGAFKCLFALAITFVLGVLALFTFLVLWSESCPLVYEPPVARLGNLSLYGSLQSAHEARQKHLAFHPACVSIHLEDIATRENAKQCLAWCDKHVGRTIYWDQRCALVDNIALVKSCDKSETTEIFNKGGLSFLGGWGGGFLYGAIAVSLGVLRYRQSEELQGAFRSAEDMVDLFSCFSIRKGLRERLDLIKKGLLLVYGIASDEVVIANFLVLGQPYYAASTIFVIFAQILINRDDCFQSKVICQFLQCWSLGFATKDLKLYTIMGQLKNCVMGMVVMYSLMLGYQFRDAYFQSFNSIFKLAAEIYALYDCSLVYIKDFGCTGSYDANDYESVETMHNKVDKYMVFLTHFRILGQFFWFNGACVLLSIHYSNGFILFYILVSVLVLECAASMAGYGRSVRDDLSEEGFLYASGFFMILAFPMWTSLIWGHGSTPLPWTIGAPCAHGQSTSPGCLANFLSSCLLWLCLASWLVHMTFWVFLVRRHWIASAREAAASESGGTFNYFECN